MLAFLAAVALAKYRFTGRSLFVVLMIGILMLPQVGLVIPLYVVLAKYQLTNDAARRRRRLPDYSCCRSRSGRCAGSSWGSRRSSRRRRWSTARAAWGRLSGSCCRWSRPGLVATSVFVFITVWNEYIFASVLLTDQSNQTSTVWLSYFYGTSRSTDWGGLMAASTLVAIPVVIFFLRVQRKIAFGLTAGSVKA